MLDLGYENTWEPKPLTDEDYNVAKNYTDKVINKYYFKTKNLILEKEEDLSKLLDNKNLLKLLIDPVQ